MDMHAIDGPFVYFVTTNATYRERLFSSSRAAMVLGQTIIGACAMKRFDVLGYCIMPDHLHLLVWNRNKSECGFPTAMGPGSVESGGNLRHDTKHIFTISDLMHSIKRNYSRHMNNGRLWQPRSYVRVVTNDHHFYSTLAYMQKNYKKHGHPQCFGQFPFVYIDWGNIEQWKRE